MKIYINNNPTYNRLAYPSFSTLYLNIAYTQHMYYRLFQNSLEHYNYNNNDQCAIMCCFYPYMHVDLS